MLYVFDTNSFIVLGHYFPSRFPTLWEKFNAAVDFGIITSVREVRKELDSKATRPHLAEFVKSNPGLFPTPSEEEMRIVAEIFGVKHFQQLVTRRNLLMGLPVADPFIVAAAKHRGGCVVTEEQLKPGAAKIPNVCKHFGVPYTNVEGFMEANGWTF